MSDLQLLFLVLAALYGAECLCWLRRGSVAFSTWLGRSWGIRHPGTLAGNQSGGFILAAPLPPLGTVLIAHQIPFSLSPAGVLAFVATNVHPGWRPAQSGGFVGWENLGTVRVRGKKLLINGERFLVAATPSFARHLGAELERLVKLTPPQREIAVSGLLRATFDHPALAARLRDYESRSAGVRRLANALFLYLVVIAPGLIWHFGLGRTWPGLLLGLLTLTIATAIFFGRAHRALYPAADEERFTQSLTIALAPSSALRAHDTLSRPLVECFHPLALAKVLLPNNEFRSFARRVLLDVRHPARPCVPSEAPEVVATEAFARHALRTATEEFLQQQELPPDELGVAPAPADAACRSFCPRCEAQFTLPLAVCGDCGGLAAVEFQREPGR